MQSGTLKCIAHTGKGRLATLPDVPAVAETLPGFDFSGWFMLMGPVGTPPDIIKKLNIAIDEATRDPQVRDLAPKLGFELDPKGVGSPQQVAEFLKGQLALWAKTTQELGIEAQ